MDLSVFQNSNLFEAGTEFFSQLGITLNSNTSFSLDASELLKDQYKACPDLPVRSTQTGRKRRNGDVFRNIDETYFLGLMDDSVFSAVVTSQTGTNIGKLTYDEADKRLTADYNGIMVFAVRLNDAYSPKRSDMVELTRAFNRISKNIPVILLLQYGSQISFATSERTRYQQQWRQGEKIGKISLLKDISVVSPHTGHLKILNGLKVKSGVTDFNALYQKWMEVFNVKLLNEKFYQELANWYFWAVKSVIFPDDAERDEEVRNATNVIRLITRLIFIWFLKKKGLIPDALFNREKLDDILNFSDKNDSTYYKAILQNLFFATLNTEMNKDHPGSRKFRHKAKMHGQRDQHYMIHNVFRYEDYFINPKDTLKRYFEDIPFLNGGLFECLDKKVTIEDKDKIIRIDGFSEHKDNVLKVPDELFFSPEKTVDLNEVYGTKNKRYVTKGLINILNSYKFTVTENTPIEEEIALDPELLGKAFENLLASYNPETKTTARKQTGSYYTPREIVNYMVDESLIAYLSNVINRDNFVGADPCVCHEKQKGEHAGSPLQDNETRLRRLLSYSEEIPEFSESERQKIISAIGNCKILDPACGSGAFPMGILHKMVHILHKLDPDNAIWKKKQIDKVDSLISEAENIDDVNMRENAIKDLEVLKQNPEDT